MQWFYITLIIYDGVSDGLLSAKWAIFQIYHGQNILFFDEIMMMSVVY